MIKVSKLADHVNGFGLGSRESFFRAVYAMRMINKGKSRGGWSITMNGAGNVEKEEEHLPEGEFERLRDSENAGEFARDVIGQLERLADKLGQDICTINPVIIDSLPGSAMNMTPPAISIVVGLINEEGKIALLVLSDEYMMVQTGSGPFSASYNEFEAGKLTTYDIERLAMTGLMDESYI